MGLLFSEKTQIIRAFKAASESVKADLDGTAPFETEAERNATKKIMEDTRGALITMGFVPEAVLVGVIEQRSESLHAGTISVTSTPIAHPELFSCAYVPKAVFFAQETERTASCSSASDSTQLQKLLNEKIGESLLR